MAARLGVVQPVDVPIFDKDLTAIDVAEVNSWDEERFIVQSPYSEKEHLLDLETLDHETAILSKALRSLTAVRDDYATALYTESFNWTEVLDQVKRLSQESGKTFKEKSYYIVAFRSQIKPSTDYGHLGDLDKAAHAEAIASGGFLRYWFGEPDPELRNLATCLWRSREDALAGGRGPAHRKAAMATREMYAFWKIDQHRLIIRDNVDSWEIVPW
ncbi:UPF0643 protein PB2B2.08 [Cladobotryum mycophilum]|uniref:UPF0643 protein PB2B2.08 n=1 Tax=Cladobotryum mycophilum TaxID=491253 RepID=A0ABR0SBC1_9HYPO